MIRILLPICLALSACADVQQATDQAGRNAAKSAIPQALAASFPQVPKSLFQPFANCIVDNADASEVQSLAADAVIGIDADTATTIRAILTRPETQNCLRATVPPEALALPT